MPERVHRGPFDALERGVCAHAPGPPQSMAEPGAIDGDPVRADRELELLRPMTRRPNPTS